MTSKRDKEKIAALEKALLQLSFHSSCNAHRDGLPYSLELVRAITVLGRYSDKRTGIPPGPDGVNAPVLRIVK